MRGRVLVPTLVLAASAAACSEPVAPDGSPEQARAILSPSAVVASATGSAHTLSGGQLRAVTFNALKKGDGSVEGQFQINLLAADVRWKATVECLTIVGNRALFGGTITQASDPRVIPGTKSYFWVEDHGEGNDAVDIVSLAGVNETQQGLDDFCGLIQNLLPPRDVVHGNVQVRG